MILCSISILAQNQYAEDEPISNMVSGVYFQAGPGSNNTLNWTYPYGTKLTVLSATHRNFELIASKYPYGELKIRQWDTGNNIWSVWRGIPTQNENGIYMVPEQFGVGLLNEARGNSRLHLSRGSEGKDKALVSYGDDGNYLWHSGLLYGGGWQTPDFYISTKESFRNGGVIVHEPEFTITTSGDVGIGTRTPDSKLAVNGNIHAQEVKVDLTGWPDYVFEREHKLPTLKEVEKHIKENGHLINIPSAQEVEENGIELGKMNKLLLEKIEELTLYIIEQDKRLNRMDGLELELEVQKQSIETLKLEIKELKK